MTTLIEASPRFEVLVNGRRLCIAGLESFGVMNVILSRVKRNPSRFPGRGRTRFTEREWSREEVDVYVGGLEIKGDDERNDRHVEWVKRRVKPGDKVVVKLLSVGRFDRPKDAGQRVSVQRRVIGKGKRGGRKS